MKTLRKSLGLVLAVIMLFSCCGGVLASAADSYDHLPQIYVCGLGSRVVYLEGDPNKESLFYPVNTDKLLGGLGNLAEYAKQSIKNLDPRIIYNSVYSILWDTFGLSALSTDGLTNKFEGVTIDPCPLKYTGDGCYEFNYDSRLSPVDLAHKLDEYIDWVKEDSGSDKVEIVASSYGTNIMMSYLQMYKDTENYNSIDSLLLCVPSVEGVNFIGELFCGNLNVDPDALYEFVAGTLNNDDVSLALSILNRTGALDVILDSFLVPTLKAAILDAFMQILRDVFGTFPSAWATIQPDYFYDALVTIFGEDYENPDHEYAVLIEKVRYYQEEVMVNARDIINQACADEIKMNVVCKYGRPPAPLSEDGNFTGDGLVELEKASFGAICAMFGEQLPEGYTQALYPEYNMISPDGRVDASTCVLPFNTWIIKGLEHGEKNAAYFRMLNDIVYNDLDVFSDPNYPQFMQVSPEDSAVLIPMLPAEPEEETPFIVEVILLFIRVFAKLAEILKVIV